MCSEVLWLIVISPFRDLGYVLRKELNSDRHSSVFNYFNFNFKVDSISTKLKYTDRSNVIIK